ncbi:cell division cycle-associated protein 7-like [Linepithema humile]|uniref:cell division cycle-associated protein 7-like n=1 Tax=Linepithema humile TaxID=83485 RepID=UPI000623A374|nr:PREDICTED: cell division cycle-associated protein 7-like [Linepithema humile]
MDENDYDALRAKNEAERKTLFAELFKDIKKQTDEIKKLEKKHSIEQNYNKNQPPRKKRRTTKDLEDFRNNGIRLEFRRKYNTRSRKMTSNGSESDSEDENNENNLSKFKSNRPKLKVLFPWAKPFQRSIDLMKIVCDVDEEEEEEKDDTSDDDSYVENKRKRRGYRTRKSSDSENIPSVDEITEEMLENVAEKSTQKTYCKINGTSCHQCRQKTLDTKTICRSGECVGVRGQFCGPCLLGRYGENAADALKDPDWACPPCRGLCNCSICRTRNGLRPTGILAPTAQEEGYSSVMDYLQVGEFEDTE